MGSKHNQERRNVDGDRLSKLSDFLIHKIFSRISTKLVVQTSILSSRWRFIWTSIPCLNLSTEDFSTLPKFSEFVTHVLSRHNNKIDVSAVKICFYDESFYMEQYAKSRRTHFSVPSLENPRAKSILEEVPALTTLYLGCVDLSQDNINSVFSKCANLKNLTLSSCRIVCLENFSICHPRLSDLTLVNMGKSVNVVAPKLENLTIRWDWDRGNKEYFIKISAPDLACFVYKEERCCLHLSTDGFNSLKKADINVTKPRCEHILCLLKHIHNVKFLTLNMEILERLSSCMEQILHQPFVFTNLNGLKIRPQSGSSESYILNSSPGDTLEEIVAQRILLKLQVFLEEEKANAMTNMSRMKRGKVVMESHYAEMLGQGKSQGETTLQDGKSVTAKIERCLKHFRVEIDERGSKYLFIVSKLQKIEEVLEKLPAAKRTLIQPSLDNVYAEAVIVMDGITDLVKTRCDDYESQISFCFQELATAWNPSY